MGQVITNRDLDWNSVEIGNKAFSKDLVTSKTWSKTSIHHVLIEPGGEIFLHNHKNEDEAHYIISGHCIGILEEQEIELNSGDILLARKGQFHGVKNYEEKDLFLICVFTPPLT